MIIVKTYGGIGNQLFQYAAGRALSLRKKTTLLLDQSSFINNFEREAVEFNKIFSMKDNVKTFDKSLFLRIFKYLSLMSGIKYIKPSFIAHEPHPNYWDGIQKVSKNCFLDGYWQSYKYFQDFETIIRDDLKFCDEIINKNKSIVEEISTNLSVSVHIRRGDFLKNEKHGTLENKYYDEAISFILKLNPNVFFYIFTDDPTWVKKEFIINNPNKFINTGCDYSDLYLMSKCAHNIIANSTYSWWAAWLNSNHDKLVISPSKWLSRPNYIKNYDQFISDLIPNRWISI